MKKSQLREMIREELQKIMSEAVRTQTMRRDTFVKWLRAKKKMFGSKETAYTAGSAFEILNRQSLKGGYVWSHEKGKGATRPYAKWSKVGDDKIKVEPL